jgi:hypothetical protein
MVSVTFVDAGSGSLIGRTELPPDQLPDTFETATTLEIADTRYSVERAEPPRSSQFRASGQLTLFLRPIQMMAAQDILYTLPTFCDWLPDSDPLLDSAPVGDARGSTDPSTASCWSTGWRHEVVQAVKAVVPALRVSVALLRGGEPVVAQG